MKGKAADDSGIQPRVSPEPDVSDLDFDTVFRTHLASVRRTLFSLGVGNAWVDDAAQDVFLIVHQKLSEFEGRSQLSTWIYAVTYRVAQNHRRKAQLRNHEAIPETAVSGEPGPAEQLAQGQAARFVKDFCDKLSDAKRDAFVLCVLEQRAAPEVAEVLGVNVDTIYSRVRKVREEFRQALARRQLEGSALS
jgi:RNA polymerase sigma-70 factor (ECF subfamily)